MNKKEPQDSNENQDDVRKSIIPNDDSEQNENLVNIESNNDLDSQLDDIKKLASDFSMDDEEDVAPFSEESENDETEMNADYLDRLSDIGHNETPFISEDEVEIGDRLVQISQDQPEPSVTPGNEIDQKSEIPALIPDDLPKKVEKKEVAPRKKPKESIDDIEQDSETIMSQSQSNEEFVSSLKSSLEDDEVLAKSLEAEPGSETVFTTEDRELDDSEVIQELENEINNADKATNPFIADEETYESDDFLTNLDKLTIPETNVNFPSSDTGHTQDIKENDHQISSSSWKDLIDSTDDDNESKGGQVFDFESEPSFDDILGSVEGTESPDSSGFRLIGDQSTSSSDGLNSLEDESSTETGKDDVEGQSVDTLRRSFIDEFDQAAQDQENEDQSKKKWLPRTLEALNKWFKSLSLAEKILIFLSFIIGIAVIVSIVLVVTQWSLNNSKIATPPSAIEAADTDLIYPTGLQLPGGWFFFLERGEVVNNRWEPQNAEWLANTKLRRVVAIPWSNQSEEVVRSLTTNDEISIFMNNNDVVVYQVEEVMQIARDNVRILSDTEPSLVVILFREDSEDRWTVIAKPKPVD